MKPGHKYSIWVTDQAARNFLWAPPANESSRWAILAEFIEYEEGVGIWVRLHQMREETFTKESVIWTVEPPRCLLFWNYIITIQALESYAEAKTAGFKKS